MKELKGITTILNEKNAELEHKVMELEHKVVELEDSGTIENRNTKSCFGERFLEKLLKKVDPLWSIKNIRSYHKNQTFRRIIGGNSVYVQ